MIANRVVGAVLAVLDASQPELCAQFADADWQVAEKVLGLGAGIGCTHVWIRGWRTGICGAWGCRSGRA